ncbi:MAG: cupin domain-containing protein [Anaerolineae bacterium]
MDPHIHAFEETFYILEGSVVVQIGDAAYLLKPGHFGLIGTGVRHAWRAVGDQPVRWLEMQSPQPRAPSAGRDTFFVGGDAPSAQASAPDLAQTAGLIGHFDESQLPRPGAPSEMEGFNPTTGVAIKMFVDRSFGAVHQSLFLIQYMPGAKIDPHDHAFEESYLIVGGRFVPSPMAKPTIWAWAMPSGRASAVSTASPTSAASRCAGSRRRLRCRPPKKYSASSATGRSTPMIENE